MRATAAAGSIQVDWNDRGDPCVISVSGQGTQITDEDLHYLYECLEFLFGKPVR